MLRFLSPTVAPLAVALAAAPAWAQDAVTLHSVTVLANNDVTVVYSKNFATCAHMRFSNATCTQNGPLTHVQNLFCASGTNVSVTVPSTAFVAGFGPGVPVYMVHGNNSGVFSPCVDVGCNGIYGAGCAGISGVPLLGANDHCPPANSIVDLQLGNALPNSVAVLGIGFGQGSFPLFGCTLLLGSLVVTATLPLDPQGASVAQIPLPPGTSGIEFTAQALVLDPLGPQGFAATNGLLVRVL